MPHYAYRALNARGRQIRGALAAANEIDLQQALFTIGLELVDCKAAEQRAGFRLRRGGRIGSRDLIQLCVHLEQMQRAGVPLLDALADVRDSTDAAQLRDLSAEIHRDVSEGQPLSAAFARHPKVFGHVFTALIAAGEETGKLADSFRQLVRHLKWTSAMTAKVKKATRYPAIVAFVVLGVTVFMMAGVVPQVVEFLEANNQALPIWTTALIATSDVVRTYWPLLLGTPVVATVLIKVMARRSEDFAYRLDALILALPVLGEVVRKIALARFAHMFAVMFQSGLDILTCLDAARKVTGNRVLDEALTLVGAQVQSGSSLSNAMAGSGAFPSRVVRMVKIGEDTGNLTETLSQVAEFYDQDVDGAIDGMIGMIEPALTAVMGLIMAWIALAVFGPIYDNLDQLGLRMLQRWLARPSRFVLVIGNEGGLLLRIAGGRLTERWAAPGQNDAALAPLARVLGEDPRTPLVVAVDLLEQAYRRESVPKVNLIDRSKVLARRLRRAFPDAALRAALKLGDDEGREQEYLFAAVPDAPEWTRWAEFLRHLENPITALALSPIEVTGLASRLARALTKGGDRTSPWTILIGRQRTGGFRQVVVDRGRLALTRLTPSLPGEVDPATLAAEIQQELKATLGYMTRLGYRAGTGIDLVVLGDEAIRPHFEHLVLPATRLHVVSVADAAEALGLGRPDPLDDDDSALLSGLWIGAQRGVTLQLLPPDLHRRLVQSRVLRWAHVGLAATALGLVSYSALSAAGGLELEQEIDWISAWRGTSQAQLARRADHTDRIGREAEETRLLLEAHRRLQEDHRDPFATLAALGGALSGHESLLGLSWQVTQPPAIRRGAPRPDQVDFTLDLTLDLGRESHPATAVAATDDLVERLAAAFPERRVTVKRHAIDVLPHQAFVGRADGAGPGGATGEPMSADLSIVREAP